MIMTGREDATNADLDAALDALANKYRRRVLVALLEHNPQDDDDRQIPEGGSLESDELDQLLLQMRHTHLPKLAESGFIEWDQETNTIRQGPQFTEIRPLLELLQNHANELPDDWL
jgi:hypothetical protein